MKSLLHLKCPDTLIKKVIDPFQILVTDKSGHQAKYKNQTFFHHAITFTWVTEIGIYVCSVTSISAMGVQK